MPPSSSSMTFVMQLLKTKSSLTQEPKLFCKSTLFIISRKVSPDVKKEENLRGFWVVVQVRFV